MFCFYDFYVMSCNEVVLVLFTAFVVLIVLVKSLIFIYPYT